MYRVKVFDCGSAERLENEVNEFLESLEMKPNFDLVDIKFNNYSYGEDNTDYHTAMIIYKI
jgi:hypothetical protein